MGAGCGAGALPRALPPHPQDLALWCLFRLGTSPVSKRDSEHPLGSVEALSRRSGCFLAWPYSPLSSR